MVQVLSTISDLYGSKFKFPRDTKEESLMTVKNWMFGLGEYSHDTVMLVLKSLLKTKKGWSPDASDIVQCIEDAQKPPEGRMTADEAWDMALEIAHRSSYHSSDLDIFNEKNTPDLMRRAIWAIGSLETLRRSPEKDTPYLRKRFVDAYNNINERLEHEPLPELSSSIQKDITQLGDGMRMIGKEK